MYTIIALGILKNKKVKTKSERVSEKMKQQIENYSFDAI